MVRARQGRRPTVERLDEEVPVLGHFERADGRPEHLHSEPVENAHLVELDANVERALPAKREEDAIRSLALNDVRDIVCGDGEEVDLRGEVMRRLDGRNVWVDEDGLDV